jgi:hypothetical protein
MVDSARWPWYAFIYRFGGAHLTFWLWIFALTGIWLFSKDAAITLLNREPHVRSVADVSSGQMYWHSWIALKGTEIKDAHRLLGFKGKSGVQLRLLLDPSDPAAIRWKLLARLADDLGPNPDSDSEQGMAFENIVSNFAKDRDLYLPWRALILVEDASIARIHSQTNIAKPLTPKEIDPKLSFLALEETKFRQRVRLIRENVIPTVAYTGVTNLTPAIQVTRIHKDLKISVSNMTMRVGREPRKRALIVFGICFFVLLFLLAGLQGVFKHDGDLLKSENGPIDDASQTP